MLGRRAFLAAGAALALVASSAQALFFKPSPAAWLGKKGVNLTKWFTNRPADGQPYGAFYSLAELQAVRARGFDHGRFAISPDPILAAAIAGQWDVVDARIAQIVGAVRLMRQADLFVNVDMHFNMSTPLHAGVMTGYSTSAPEWKAMEKAFARLAAALMANFAAQHVCMDMFNEPPSSANATWGSVQAPALWAAIRAAAPGMTIIVQGGDLGNIPALSQLNPALFDRNTLFSGHYYESVHLTNCARPGAGDPVKRFSNIPYPPDGIDPAPYITAARARVTADVSLSQAQKDALNGVTPTTGTIYVSLTDYFTNHTARWHELRMQFARDWVNGKVVDPSQIYIGEAGCAQRSDGTGTGDADRGRWFQHVRTTFEARNIRFAIWCWDDDDFSLKSPTTGLIAPEVASGLALN